MKVEILVFIIGITIVQGVGFILLFAKVFKKAPQGMALVRNGIGGQRVSFNAMMVYPIVHQLSWMDLKMKTITIENDLKNSLIISEENKVTARFTFYVRINPNEMDVLRASTWLGDEKFERLALPVFERKFEEVISIISQESKANDWMGNRMTLKEKLIMAIGRDLNGFILDDLAIDRVKVH